VRRADNLAILMCRCLKTWEPRPPGALRTCMGPLYLYLTSDLRVFITVEDEVVSYRDLRSSEILRGVVW
jgi:hypothetical protein